LKVYPKSLDCNQNPYWESVSENSTVFVSATALSVDDELSGRARARMRRRVSGNRAKVEIVIRSILSHERVNR
jgi:hypothetical protein